MCFKSMAIGKLLCFPSLMSLPPVSCFPHTRECTKVCRKAASEFKSSITMGKIDLGNVHKRVYDSTAAFDSSNIFTD